MSKRDNPRLWQSKETSGKNKRSAHSIGRDGRLSKESASYSKDGKKSFGKKSYSEGKSYGEKKTYGKGYSKIYDKSENYGESRNFSRGKTLRQAGYGEAGSFADRRNRNYDADTNPNLIIGRNPVTEALKSGRSIDKILMQKDAEGSARKIASMARENKVQLQYVDKLVLDKLAPGRPHQGVAAYVAAKDYVSVDAILKNAADKGEDPLIVILDGLEDPHNLGAVLRSCDGAGAHGVIIPSHRAVGLTETVAKASAGAIEYIPVAKVTNLSQTIEELKAKGLWIASIDMDGENYSDAKLTGPLALVIGGEGQGVSRLVREKSDYIVSMPMHGKVNSLNASNAAAIMLYEVDRQRSLNK